MKSRLNYLAALFAAIIIIIIIGHVPVQADWNYITLSSYYVFPGQGITVNGGGFMPNETVTVSLGGTNKTANTNGAGSFTSPSFTIPTAAVHSKITVTASNSNGQTSQAVLTVAGYYPTVAPSSYYIAPGGQLSFSGKNFEPNEPITIANNGLKIASITTDSGGGFTTGNFTVPNSAGDQTYTFSGQNSRANYNVTVHVSGTRAVIVLNHYYGPSGTTVQLAGQFFGAGETVKLAMGGANLGQATANQNGNFNFNFNVPSFPAASVQTITATGEQTGKTAQTQYTLSYGIMNACFDF